MLLKCHIAPALADEQQKKVADANRPVFVFSYEAAFHPHGESGRWETEILYVIWKKRREV